MNTKTETTTVCVTSDKRWAIAEFDEFAGGTIYVAYGELPDFERYTVERLGQNGTYRPYGGIIVKEMS